MLDDESLLQIFSHCRLNDEENWNLRFQWRKLTNVCQRWRCLVFNSRSHLDMCLLLTNDSPPLDTLRHLPSLPLVIDYSARTRTVARKDEDNIRFGLQRHGRICRVALRAPSSSLRMWLELMNKPFPRLGDLSLSTEEMSLVLPETFQAPFLCRLSLNGIGLPRRLLLLSSMIALSTLSLTHIPDACYFPPIHLVAQLQSLLYLEELSIGFAIPIPLPSSEGELLPRPIPPVTLPALRWLTFRGVGAYLENLVAQISAPLLEQLTLTLFFELAFTLVNLTEFIRRTRGFVFPVARVIFNEEGVSIDAGHDEQRGVGKFGLYVHVNCEALDWQIDSATQVCDALRNVLSAVEELTIDLDVDGIPSNWENALESMLWHELLLPFIGVKKLHISFLLTLELSQALESAPEELVLELLPELQELEVQLEIDSAREAFSAFVETRESAGRPIHLSASPIPQYLNQATQLISGYRTFIHAQGKTICSYNELRR
jgi:hypothetical protein